MADYNSVHSGQEIDSAVSAVKQKESTWDGKLDASQKGAAGGVATLDTSGKVPSTQLPEMDYDPAGSAQAVQSNLNSHTNNQNNPHSVTAAQVGAAVTASYTVDIDTSWSSYSYGGYYKTVSVSGVLSSDDPFADVVLGTDVEENAQAIESWSMVTRITTATNSITLYTNQDKPTVAFTIKLKVVR